MAALAEAARICHAIAEAVGAAHEAGVIHRDLKPDNVMFDSRGNVKVLDFGLARLDDTATADEDAETDDGFHTQAGRILGTPGYMAPEQATGREVDGRADQFAIGVILRRAPPQRPEAGPSSHSHVRPVPQTCLIIDRIIHKPALTTIAPTTSLAQAWIRPSETGCCSSTHGWNARIRGMQSSRVGFPTR